MTFRYKFVEFIPEILEEQIVYISIDYRTAVHQCACGCGSKVVTPISPNDWKLTFDGKTISLQPSIGNWSFPCRSHYYIRKNEIDWVYKEEEFTLTEKEEEEETEKKSWKNIFDWPWNKKK